MDKQHRLSIPDSIRNVTKLNFKNEVRLYLILENNDMLLSNDSNLDLPCLGIVNFDDKYRFYIPKELREYLNLTADSKLLIYTLKANIIIKKI